MTMRRGWLRYRSAPYAWERALLWLLIIACFGADVGERLAHAPQLVAIVLVHIQDAGALVAAAFARW